MKAPVPRPPRRWPALLGLLAFASLAPLAPPAAGAGDPTPARRAYLAEELAAAQSEDFYLVFDPGAAALDLKIEGVRVHRFVLDRAELGQPRLSGGGERRWPAVAFTLATEIPAPVRPRIEIRKAAEADKALDDAIKQAIARGKKPAGELSETAGEKVARENKVEDPDAPVNFVLEFEPGLLLVVRGEPDATDVGSVLRRAGYALQEGWHGVLLWLRGGPPRARVVAWMPPEDARRLFKVLTPKLRLLVYAPPG